MNLIELFQVSFRGRAEKPAIDFGGNVYTFGELDRLSDAAAFALRERFGVRQGDRLSMYLGNCHELVIWYLAGLKLGASLKDILGLSGEQLVLPLLPHVKHGLDDETPRARAKKRTEKILATIQSDLAASDWHSEGSVSVRRAARSSSSVTTTFMPSLQRKNPPRRAPDATASNSRAPRCPELQPGVPPRRIWRRSR